ncbi:1-(5-phosphoribosyl)-5-[(5-phosphoribosylamino)methylideneamino]imidazole-4-carboxamide isomerase [Putridiphycobacter roseus]|uniref:1-(5-phosphoribosyl)-5-[(5-phosphoribosylamino)methylideneamino] imidazole-4-carboxamide isomerase n=1 Tax=Putridiphycobacter roseus TaxID=2219161 RepID=A0A2W1MV74_9FLAO|nr:1-(5-phosphoribosyl)-5-[(5-phosphoribosylamino)methylideneamino]imidazole-4-carboxamide isomerase [Putridiphycobacter roseus]PZE15989.1 1-(5-phosphoribosyl)-5-[(5-phosphoribosylamino)methylideneamino]imidazole-4-carboxamide isomerase [Putridiphycobacter roseus]
MRIIPAIDIIDGKCIRLTKGNYDAKKIYNNHPLEVAKSFEDHGVQYLHVVDLDGAKANKVVNNKILEEIATQTNLKIEFGGGIRGEDDLVKAFEAGADQVIVGSVAVQKPDVFLDWLSKFGQEKIILGADCMNRKIATNAWLATSEIDVVDYIKNYRDKGVQHVICTEISKDGMLAGTANDLYKEIIAETKVDLIGSGGVSSLQDLELLAKLGCAGAIIGKAFYEGKITLEDLGRIC